MSVFYKGVGIKYLRGVSSHVTANLSLLMGGGRILAVQSAIYPLTGLLIQWRAAWLIYTIRRSLSRVSTISVLAYITSIRNPFSGRQNTEIKESKVNASVVY